MTDVSPVTYVSGTAVSDTKFYLSSFLDDMVEEHGNDVPFTRFFVFKYLEKNQGKWFYHDVEFYTIGTCFRDKNSEKFLYALGEDGEIEKFNGITGEQSFISGAGLREDWSNDRGYMDSIRNLGGILFATGYGAQIFKEKNNTWIDWSDGLLGLSTDDDISVIDICNRNNNDFFCVGRYENRGLLAYRTDSTSWSVFPKATPAILYGVTTLKNSSVLACGAHGNLLEIDTDNNIKRHSNLNITLNFFALAEFKGSVYIASDAGIYQFKDNQISQININSEVDENFIVAIESTDNILWACTEKYVLRFDGTTWEIFKNPDNLYQEEQNQDSSLKCYAGERCPQSGNWYSHANQMQKRYFSEGEVMPEIENNAWGKTIWYMDI